DPSCAGYYDGYVGVNVQGGSAPYYYQWSGGGGNSSYQNYLSGGSYDVTVWDYNNCSVTTSISITPPHHFSLTGNTTDATCFGSADGAVDISVQGGVEPYTYAWGPGSAITEDISGLSGDTYMVTVTDWHGCVNASQYVVNEPAAIVPTAIVTNA